MIWKSAMWQSKKNHSFGIAIFVKKNYGLKTFVFYLNIIIFDKLRQDK